MPRSTHRTTVAVLVLAALVFPVTGTAQEGKRAAPQRPAEADHGAEVAAPKASAAQPPALRSTRRHPSQVDAGEPSTPDRLISVDAPIGTVRDYVRAVQAAAAPHPVNVSVPEEAAAITLPAISLRLVSPYIALQAISTAFPAGGPHRFEVNRIDFDPGSEPLYAVQYERRAAMRFTPNGQAFSADLPRQTEVFSIRDLLASPLAADADAPADPSTILSAVEATLLMTLEEASEPADVRFHEESGLLIVRGSAEHVSAVGRVLRLMQEDAAKGVRPRERSFTTQKFILSHVTPQFVADSLARAFPGIAGNSGGVQASADPSTNSVIVDARSDLAPAVRALVIALDRPADRGDAGELEKKEVLLDSLRREIETLRNELTRSTQSRVEAEERLKMVERDLNR